MPSAFLPDRTVFSVSGPEARAFLQNLVTCDVDPLQVGDGAFGALLTPQGKILFDFFVVCAEPELFYLDVDAALAPALATRLAMYKLRAKIEISTTPKQVLAVWGGTGAPEGLVYPDVRAEKMGSRVILGIVDDPGDLAAYEAHRIASGVPRGGVDFAWGDTFPHEANMDRLSGVSFSKGCYVGQEVVSRTQHRGTARRRILRATFDSEAPAPGTEVRAGDALLGTFGSSAQGHGLASVRTDRLADAQAAGASITAGERPVTLAPFE